MGQLIRDSCATMPSKETLESPTPLYHAARTQRDNREGETVASADRNKIQTTVVREWKERWQREVDRSGRAEELADEPPAKEHLKLHDGLQKVESSLLVQMRTGKIRLRAFLFERRVPDDSNLFMWRITKNLLCKLIKVWRWPGNSTACGRIQPDGSCGSRCACTEISIWR